MSSGLSANSADYMNSLHKSKEKNSCTELSNLNSDIEMESMPKLRTGHEGSSARTNGSQSGSCKSQFSRVNLPNVSFNVLLVGNETSMQ